MRWRLFAGIAAVLVVAVAFWVQPGRSVDVRELRSELVSAAASRPYLARLVGPFAHAPVQLPVRGSTSAPAISPELTVVAARIEALARDTLRADVIGLAGEARLLLGQETAAITALELAARERSDARTLTNLGAAYLSRADGGGEPGDLARGLEMTSRAISRDDAPPEAHFNQALAFEMAGLRPFAIDAWRQYLERDRRGSWAAEARSRLQTLGSAVERPPVIPVDPVADAAETLASESAQPLREWLEHTGAGTWASAVAAGERQAAQRHAMRLVALADALARYSGDRQPLLVAREMLTGRSGLARGHLAYTEGLTLYRKNDREAALSKFQTAERALATAGSVQRHWASLQIALIHYYRRDLADAKGRLDILRLVARKHGWKVLDARVSWLRGVIAFQQGSPADALSEYARAARIYESAGERENAGVVYNTAADTLRALGDRHAGWEYLRRSLAYTSAFREPIRRYLVFFNASLYAARDGLPHASLHFQNAAVNEAAGDTRSPAAHIEARLRRAAVLGRMRRHSEAATDLAAARPLIDTLPDRMQARYFAATAAMVEGELFPSNPAALAGLEEALTFFRGAEPAEVPRLLLARALAQQAQGAVDAAERSLVDAIDEFSQRRKRLESEDDRIAYLGEGVDLFDELARVRLRLRRADSSVFDAIEQGRARTLFEDLAGVSAAIQPLVDLHPRVPPEVSIVAFSVMPDRLLMWLIEREGVRFRQADVSSERVTVAVDMLDAALSLGATPAKLEQTAAAVARLVVDTWGGLVPAGKRIVIVPDGPLHRVPFALLPGPGGQPLITRHALSIAPSVNLFLASHERSSVPGKMALLVGNPTLDAESARSLRSLGEAEAEVREIGARYPGARTLVGAQATSRAILDALPSASVFHFAGHAVADPASPSQSRLMVAAGDGTAIITAREISRLDLSRVRLVVLAACQTAGGPVRAGEGVMSLARPFLAAGAPTVVGSLWDLNDGAARAAFPRLHREIVEGRSVSDALRKVQIAMMQSDDPLLRDPASWAGLVVVGAGAAHNLGKGQEVR